ncbi:MAG: hypothetical protein NTY19_08960 [Planctomycetota bacterium]|nr:hypothetical protein [Planctomycetota bacterium]
MDHGLLHKASFWLFLFAIDRDLADSARRKACSCGGRLHCANFPRKPRGGGAELPEQYGCRLSFCCDQEDCRKRLTPPSVRFLGRKVYLGAVVVLVAAMRQGAAPRRVRELSKLFGADRRTIARWQTLWCEHFPQTQFWKVARALLVPTVDVTILPLALVEAFLGDGDPCQGWGRLLQFLAPITVAGGWDSKVFR